MKQVQLVLVGDSVLQRLLLEIFVAMAPIQMECTVVDCNLGAAGARYKTPALEEQVAIQMLNNHREDTHARGQGGRQEPERLGGEARSKVEKVPRPSLQKGISEDKYLHFKDTLMEALYLIEPCSIVHVMSFQAKWLGSFIFRVELSISILEKQIQFTNIPSR